MLEMKDISVIYEKGGIHKVIDQMSWKLETGTVLAVAGPSGCGKSTMIHSLAGILPYEGSITLDGTGLDPKTCSIGLIPQNYGLLPWKTVRENCLFTAKIRGNIRDMETRLSGLCKELGIDGLSDRYPGTLSGGQAQRVALARAFLMDPKLLLMDEPFAALDIGASLAARELFLRIWKEKKPTTVIVTHRVEDALYLAHKIAVMERGGGFNFFSTNPWQGIIRPSEAAYGELAQQITEKIIKADEI
ncbi:MAG: ATP-binding cassette domain-containing protein [Lacrimispora celerecrescens]|uniref:ATP-binding cassette domain-containing protein n=1 Tax=Lacrimispora indolis TaxID=69825 RepID=UPI000407D5F4|nr:ATP-binding cassette domain-containing protein [[Clostridium] methoxybenzovorans]MBE7722024.1 ATP-binding cassette domain-containing protein [Lacrimispora celerecrescens]